MAAISLTDSCIVMTTEFDSEEEFLKSYTTGIKRELLNRQPATKEEAVETSVNFSVLGKS